jgi:Cu/Ag efflux protein CusF
MRRYIAAFITALAATLPLLAAHAGPAADYTDAEVRRIDAEAGRITLRHGEIRNLDMPPMTMAFQLRPGTAPAGLKPGDKVRFKAEKEAGGYVVTEIVRAP